MSAGQSRYDFPFIGGWGGAIAEPRFTGIDGTKALISAIRAISTRDRLLACSALKKAGPTGKCTRRAKK